MTIALGPRRSVDDCWTSCERGAAECSSNCGENGHDLRQAVAKHLAVIEDANLVTILRLGETLHFTNPEPINAIAKRWISKFDRAAPRRAVGAQTHLGRKNHA